MNSTVFRNHLFYEFVSVTNSSFFVPQSSLEAEVRRGSRSRCDYCPSFSRSRTRHKCQVCFASTCQTHFYINCENCITDVKLKVAIPVAVRSYQSPKIQCKTTNCTSRTLRHCERCLLSFCRKHLYVVCPMCSCLSRM